MNEINIKISDVLEYLYCPRFIYFIHCLKIPQYEDKRFKVIKGREVHELKRRTNIDYTRIKINVVKKENNVIMIAKNYHIKGIADEILFLTDGTAAPLEYKFAEYKGKIFKTYRNQLILQSLMIKDNYHLEVKKAFICFVRSKNQVIEIEITEKDFQKSINIIEKILKIIQLGLYPKKTKQLRKCLDCCYNKICY